MLSTTTALPREASWGDTLKSYQAERKQASWEKSGQAHPPKDHRVTHYEKRSKFNPLLQRHYDPSLERAARATTAAADASKLGAAIDRQPPFDIVTHKFREGKVPPDKKAHNKPPDSRTSWNIINHRQKDGSGPAAKSNLQNMENGLLPASWKRREFDIVSNKYIHDHKERTLRDRTAAKHDARHKFWGTHDFDPLLGRYYDDGKESDFRHQREVLSGIAGQGSIARLPPAVQFCEGAAYDIVSHAVKDPEKLAVASGVGNRAIASKKGPSVDAMIRDRSLKRDERDKSRALARFAKTVEFCEREGGRHHGYDVLTHESHVGRGAKPMVRMRIEKPASSWRQLEVSARVVNSRLSTHPVACSRRERTNVGLRSKTAGNGPSPRTRDLSGASPPKPRAPRSEAGGPAPERASSFSVPMRKDTGRSVAAPVGDSASFARPPVPALKIPA